MAAQKDWKLVAVLIVLVCSIVGIIYIIDNLQTDAAQNAQHECKSNTNKCHPYAYCYGNETSYVCTCVPGWDGDGFVGDGHSGCQRRRWRLVGFIRTFGLVGLVLLGCSVDAASGLRARIWNNSQRALAQQAYPHQGIGPSPVEEV